MNRTDRLLAIILELQAKGWQRAEDLATHFEVSKRTIYRDMQALAETGVPVMSEPGRGYSIVDGYFLPPLHFTVDEAMLLLLGADMMAQSFDDQYERVADEAASKIKTALPTPMQSHIEQLQSLIQFVSMQPPIPEKNARRLKLLRRAIIECHTIRFDYFSRPTPHHEPTATQRDADPYSLVHVNNAWYVTGYCHLRKAMRRFRLDRMERVRLIGGRFERPDTSTYDENPQDLTVKALFKPEVSRWVQEDPSFFQVAAEETPNGLLVTLRVRHQEDVLPWLLAWGARVRVLEPESLRERIVQEAQAMIAQSQPITES